MIKLAKNTFEIGLEKPVKLLHVTDTHLTLADELDDEKKRQLAKARGRDFGDVDGSVEANLREQIAYSKENCDLLVHSGDLIDFVSHANVAKAREILKDDGIFFIAGNHEYSRWVGEAWEDLSYRMTSYMQMGFGLGVPMFWNSRVVGGVNIVGIDNGYYHFADWQTWRLRREAEKGLPIVLVFHDPLFEQSLYDHHMAKPHADCAYIVGCDEEHLLPYSEFRSVQQRPDEPTLRMIDYIKSEPLIKLILTGHLHYNFESVIRDGLPQIVTGCGSDGTAREITLE
ncbi:MAG: metallophosphoesterase [Clostridia bacterium]|nr:metallophosphoesterase [Clostridia bacterium]